MVFHGCLHEAGGALEVQAVDGEDLLLLFLLDEARSTDFLAAHRTRSSIGITDSRHFNTRLPHHLDVAKRVQRRRGLREVLLRDRRRREGHAKGARIAVGGM